MPAASQSEPDNPYEITGVQVDVTAENAAAARSLALADGARQALAQLVERYVPEDRRARFARMSQQQIDDMINDFSIRSEKTSSVRYIATLDYRFKPSRVGRLLRSAGAVLPTVAGQPVPSSTEAPPPKPIIVLPVLEAGPGQAPGGGADPWRDAWQSIAERSSGRYVLATGDTAGISGDQERLDAMVRNAGGDSALVAVAAMRGPQDGEPAGVDVSFVRQGSKRRASGSKTYTPNEDESAQAFFRRVAAATQSDAATAWRQSVASAPAQRAEVQVAVPVSSLDDWLQLQKQIRDADGIRGVNVVLLSRREMLVNLSYSGTPADLALRLEDADLALRESDGRRVLTRDTSPIEPADAGVPDQ